LVDFESEIRLTIFQRRVLKLFLALAGLVAVTVLIVVVIVVVVVVVIVIELVIPRVGGLEVRVGQRKRPSDGANVDRVVTLTWGRFNNTQRNHFLSE
jgi:hypothetical protein